MTSPSNLAFNSDQHRAGATVGYLCHKAGIPISVLKMLKLIYLAQRESLRRYGEPIFHEQYANTPVGPLPFMTLGGLCSGGLDLTSQIGLRGKVPEPAKEFLALSAGDIELLDEVWQKFGKMDDDALAAYTSSDACPEGAQVQGKPQPIEMERLLGAVGYSAEGVQSVMEYLAVQAELKGSFRLGDCGHA